MIKPLNTPQLSAARPRVGLQKVSDLIPRLIRMYELQAEMVAQEVKREVAERTAAENTTREFEQPLVPANALAAAVNGVGATQQSTFGWYE